MDAREALIKELENLEVCNSDSAPQYVVRCPYCGDSIKDTSHTHFSILIDLIGNKPILYRCFRCQESGLLGTDTMRMLSINNRELINSIVAFNKNASKDIKKALGYSRKVLGNITIPIPKYTKAVKEKQDYFNSRLGTNYSLEELTNMKIILDFQDFCRHNNISKFHAKNGMLHMLNNKYIGFLSVNNESIVFRAIDNSKLRYFKYKIFGEIFTQSFVTIPQEIDLFSNMKTIIHLTEGPFDIFGVKSHIEHSDSMQHLFISVCSSDFLGPIKYIIGQGIIDNFEIRIYSDNEPNRQPRFYNNIKRELSMWTNKIYLFYNQRSKDYGVTKNKIDSLCVRL